MQSNSPKNECDIEKREREKLIYDIYKQYWLVRNYLDSLEKISVSYGEDNTTNNFVYGASSGQPGFNTVSSSDVRFKDLRTEKYISTEIYNAKILELERCLLKLIILGLNPDRTEQKQMNKILAKYNNPLADVKTKLFADHSFLKKLEEENIKINSPIDRKELNELINKERKTCLATLSFLKEQNTTAKQEDILRIQEALDKLPEPGSSSSCNIM